MKLRANLTAATIMMSTACPSIASAKESYFCYEEAATGFVIHQGELKASPYPGETWLVILDGKKAAVSSKRGSYNLSCETSYSDALPDGIIHCKESGRLLVLGKATYKFSIADVGGYVMAAELQGISIAYGKCQRF